MEKGLFNGVHWAWGLVGEGRLWENSMTLKRVGSHFFVSKCAIQKDLQ